MDRPQGPPRSPWAPQYRAIPAYIGVCPKLSKTLLDSRSAHRLIPLVISACSPDLPNLTSVQLRSHRRSSTFPLPTHSLRGKTSQPTVSCAKSKREHKPAPYNPPRAHCRVAYRRYSHMTTFLPSWIESVMRSGGKNPSAHTIYLNGSAMPRPTIPGASVPWTKSFPEIPSSVRELYHPPFTGAAKSAMSTSEKTSAPVLWNELFVYDMLAMVSCVRLSST